MCAVSAFALTVTSSAFASSPATDDACAAAYTGGNYNGQDGDVGGFGAWQVIPTVNGGSSGAFVGSSANNGGGCASGNINCNVGGSKSWGMYANSGQASGLRTFPGGLVVGQTFTMEMDNGNINGPYSANNVVEVQLMNASGVRRWGVHFRGGAGEYQTYDAANTTFERGTGLGFSDAGLRIAFTITGANSYSVTLTRLAGGSVTHTGTLASSGDIDRVFVLVRSAGSGCNFDAFWNKMNISACPAGFPACTVTKDSGTDIANTQNTFSAPAGNTSYSWALSANSSGASISGSATSPNVTVNNGTTAGSYTITVTIDNNGCISTCSQTITVTDPDVTPPTVTCPPQYNSQCGVPAVANSIAAFISQGGSASDSGPGSLSIQHLGDSTISGSGCLGSPQIIERAYRVYDGTGNFTDCTQMIVLEDTQLPSITCPAGASFTCISQVPAVNVNVVTASDNCGAATVTHVGDVQSNPGSSCNNTITRTYRATDSCGNFSECTQVFVVNDNVAPTVTCADDAADNSSNSDYGNGWQTGDNGGSGFGSWTLTTTSGNVNDNGHFIGSSTGNGNGDGNADGDINVSGAAFGLYANSGNTAGAIRPFGALQVGQTISLRMDNGFISTSSTVGFGLRDASNVNRLEFYFTGGNSFYRVSDSAGVNNTTLGFSDEGMNVSFTLTGANTYSLTVSQLVGGSQTITGTLSAGGPITNLRLFNFNAGSGSASDAFFNSLAIDRDVTIASGCGATLSDLTGYISASDNCSSAVVSQSPAAGTVLGVGTTVVTLNAVDVCGNVSANCTIDVVTTDTTAPVITCPANATVECTASTDPSNTGSATAVDACSGAVTATYSDTVAAGSCPQAKTITRTWSATDGSGNTATCVQTISVVDSTAPVVTAPADVTIGCLDSTAPSATGTGTGFDACDVSTASTSTATVASENFNSFRGAGFTPSPSATQLDSDFWSIGAFSDTPGTLAFGGTATSGDFARGTVTNGVVTGGIYAFAVSSGNFALGFQPSGTEFNPGQAAFRGVVNSTPNTITTLNVSYTIYVRNNEGRANSFNFSHSPNGSSYTAEPSLDFTSGVASNSGVFVAVPRSITLTGLSIAPGGLYYLRWTSADVSGAGSRDEFALDDIVVTTPVVTFSGGVSVSYTDVTVGTCPVTITRTWSATDACGNTGTDVQTISIVDNTAPTLSGVPANVTVQCTAVPAAATVTATDTCDPNPSVALNETTSAGSCAGNYTITRTWTATDSCGNSSSGSQVITVQDTVAPVITTPADASVECGGDTSPASTGSATATDACSGATVSHSDVTTAGSCPQGYTITRTWTAVDGCGNSASSVQTITVADTTDPVLTVPANTSIECTDSPDPAANGIATATDACDVPVVTVSSATVASENFNSFRGAGFTTTPSSTQLDSDFWSIGSFSDSPGTLAFGGTATSGDWARGVTTNGVTTGGIYAFAVSSGNFVLGFQPAGTEFNPGQAAFRGIVNSTPNTITTLNVSYVVYVRNNETRANSFNFSHSANGSSYTAEPTLNFTSAAAADALGWVAHPRSITLTGLSIAPGNLYYLRWNSADVSGAGSRDEFGIDDILVTTPVTSIVGGPTVLYSDSTSGTCPAVITRTWTATDACGNSVSADQTITVNDTTAPSISVPANATVECTGDTSPAATGSATGSDDCGSVTVSSSDSEVAACGNTKTITRTWTVTDDCGNSVSADQVITVVDTTAPSISVPADATVECTGDTSPAATGSATGSDTCGGVTVTSSDASVGGCGNTEVITRTWTVTDECGNSVSADQVITVVDTTAPSISVPADATVECTGDTSPAATGSATGSDTCGSVTVASSDSEVAACGNTKTITRTWTVTDECGNSVSGDQTITVVDTTAPTLNGVPADETVECDSVPAAATVTASDSCGSASVSLSESSSGTCPEVITRTWTATDDCGNTASASQVITVQDTTAPVLTTPADVSATCEPGASDPSNTGSATATDSCGAATVTYSDSIAGVCPATVITRTWTATDSCGNTASSTQIITLSDTAKPVLSGCPEDIEIRPCDTVPAPATVTAVDACNGAITVVYSQVTVTNANFDGGSSDDDDSSHDGHSGSSDDSSDCGQQTQNTLIIRTWTATDSCGNSASCSQVITVNHVQNCVFSQGYWKTHAGDWPVTSLTIGCTTYTQAQLLTILNTPPQGKATYILAHQLIAALLNVELGACTSAQVQSTITSAQSLLCTWALNSNPPSSVRNQMTSLACILDDFNNAKKGNRHCSSDVFNHPPVAMDDMETTSENTPVIISILDNDVDSDGDSIGVIVVGTPSSGTAIINENGTITYTPNNGFVGSDSFTYVIADGEGGFSAAVVMVFVQAGVPPPPSGQCTDDVQSCLARSSVYFTSTASNALSKYVTFEGTLTHSEGNLAADFRDNNSTAQGSLKVTLAGTEVYNNLAVPYAVSGADPVDNNEKWEFSAGATTKATILWKDSQHYDADRDPNYPVNIGKLFTRFIHASETEFRFEWKSTTKKPLLVVVDGIVIVKRDAAGNVSSTLPNSKSGSRIDVVFPARLVPGNTISWYNDANPGDGFQNLLYTQEATSDGISADTYFNAGGEFYISVPATGININAANKSAVAELTIGEYTVTLVGCSEFEVDQYNTAPEHKKYKKQGKNWNFNDDCEDCGDDDSSDD
jgi:Bacterial Ig domain